MGLGPIMLFWKAFILKEWTWNIKFYDITQTYNHSKRSCDQWDRAIDITVDGLFRKIVGQWRVTTTNTDDDQLGCWWRADYGKWDKKGRRMC